MRVRLEKDGATLLLEGEPLARGGEAVIWPLPERPGLLAKVYLEPTPERGDKLSAMLANPPDDPTAKQNHTSIAWPAQRLLGEDGGPAGFVMPRVEKAVPLFDVYNPKSRLQTWPLFHYGYLLRTARNLAIAVRALHARGYVLGDLNESNVLVNAQALVTVVDTDSFQVRAADRLFRCEVGKPEYMAPEIQGADFRRIDRTTEQDNFALAVLIFQLLMQGTHPFAGKFTGQGEPEVPARRIAAGFWPYARKPRGPYEPNPTAPPFVVLPFPVRELMRQCFEDGHDRPASRPGATDWQKALAQADAELTDCPANAQHRFHGSLDACPWCELRDRQGRDPFPSREQVRRRAEPAVAATADLPWVLPLAPAKSKPPIRPKRVPVARKPAPAWLRALLTPWPWVIGGAAVGLLVLVWMIATNTHKPVVQAAAGPLLPNLAHPKDAHPGGNPVRPPENDGPRVDENPPRDATAGEFLRFMGQDKAITSVALSGEGGWALSGGLDGKLRVWDAQTGRERLHLDADAQAVYGVAIPAVGYYAVSGGADGCVHLWNLDAGAEIRSFPGHDGPVRCVALSADGGRALSGGDDHTMRWWSVDTGEQLRAFSESRGVVTSVAFSPDGARGAYASADGLVRVWDLDHGKEPLELSGHEGPVRGAAFSPDGGRIVSGGDDGTVRIWNADSGEPIKAFPAHDGAVNSVAFTPDGRGVWSGGDDGTVRLWDPAEAAELCRFNNKSRVAVVAVGGADGRRVLSGGDDGDGRLWALPEPTAKGDHAAGHAAPPMEQPPTPPPSPDKPAPSSADKPAGQRLAFKRLPGSARCVALSPDGGNVVAGCTDGEVYLLDAVRGASTVCKESHQGAVTCVAFSADGSQAASGDDQGLIFLWDAKDGSALRNFVGPRFPVLFLSFSKAAGLLQAGYASSDPPPVNQFGDKDNRADGQFQLWKTSGAGGAIGFRGGRSFGPGGLIECMAFLPQQKCALFVNDIAGSLNRQLVVWSLPRGREEKIILADNLGTVQSIAVSPVGDKAVTAAADDDVRLWNLPTSKEVLRFKGHTGTVWCAAFSPAGDRVLTAGDDGTVRLWDANTGDEISRFTGHAGPVRAVAFSADGTLAVSGGDDGTVRVWELPR